MPTIAAGTHVPPQVHGGEKVSIVSPSGPADPQYLAPALNILRQWGLIPVVAANVSVNFKSPTAACAYLAGSDEERVDQLIRAFEDPDTTAVICSRGGYGSARLIDGLLTKLPREVLRKKRFVGFSDITVLHALFQRLDPELITFHGPMPASPHFCNASEAAQLHLKAALFEGQLALACPPITGHVIQPGASSVVQGKVLGGNLCVLASLVGSKAWPELRGGILVLEDVGEEPYKVDRMITTIQNAMGGELWNLLSGLVLGDFGNQVSDVKTGGAKKFWVETMRVPASLPILGGLDIGHIHEHKVVPFGCTGVMDMTSGTISFSAESTSMKALASLRESDVSAAPESRDKKRRSSST